MKSLPFKATTRSGSVYDIEFPLHQDTGSAVTVSQTISATLDAISQLISLHDEVSNGDVLQGVAMALAIRAAMIEAPNAVTASLTRELVESALAAVDEADQHHPVSGHA